MLRTMVSVVSAITVILSGSPSPSVSESPSPTPSVTPSVPVSPTPTATPTPVDPTPADPVEPTPSPVEPTTSALGLTLDQPAPQWEDRPVVLGGRLSTGASGWFISLWQNTSSGWVLRGTTRTTTGGAYRITHTWSAPGHPTLQAVIGGSYSGKLGRSPIRYGTISNRSIVLVKPASAYVALTGVSVSGKVTPAEPGRQVVLDYLSGGTWRGLRTVGIDAQGNFRAAVPDNFPTRWTVRARTVEPAAEYTSAATFTVHAYLNPRVYTVTASDIPSTYRSGCPVGPSKLRRLVLTHWGFDARLHRGELIVRDAAVSKMISVWNAAVIARFPIRRMQRVDVFGGSDIKAMEADNTSAFNCRQVTGNPYALSPHSYGYAIDINTVENPYLAANGVWYPSNGLSYRNRSWARPGMLFKGSTPTKALLAQAYIWGALWRNPDYQHFQPR
ncbi:M15 family metallopeptidase [Kribbella sp. NBC_01245]|uniref:M15 family metallopeptidase n=1 Tax=Kribbella sp. NBC_01245 TaxID=2903578 RepID=UPI002E2BF8EE|nr:M15 family metallopeptidase [Kribbella sp. NBC_01245]